VDWGAFGAALTGALLAIAGAAGAVAEYYRRKRAALSLRPPRAPRESSPPPIASDAPTPPRGTRLR